MRRLTSAAASGSDDDEDPGALDPTTMEATYAVIQALFKGKP